jgi:uncharacterized membrane protein
MPGATHFRYDFQRLTQTFVTGAIAILPLVLTLAVLIWLVKVIHDLLGPTSLWGSMLRSVGMSVVACDVLAYVVGLTGTVLIILGLGVIVESGSFPRWRRAFDDALHRVPLVGTVYDASKQMTSMFDRKPDAGQNMVPVICFFGNDRSTAIPALMPTAELVRLGGIDYRVVMIPTAPVPFGGALLCVRASWVHPMDCGFEELVGVYMSMGVTAPKCLGDLDREQAGVKAPLATEQL